MVRSSYEYPDNAKYSTFDRSARTVGMEHNLLQRSCAAASRLELSPISFYFVCTNVGLVLVTKHFDDVSGKLFLNFSMSGNRVEILLFSDSDTSHAYRHDE